MADAGAAHMLSLTTVLGGDILQAVSFQAEETLGAPFAVDVEALSDQSAIDPTTIIYTAACLTVTRGGGTRLFNGMVRAIRAAGAPQRGQYRYRLSIVPKLWFLSQTGDCRIFQQKTVPQIIETICGEAGQAIKLSIYGSPAPLEYVTQYNETDSHFIGRLMEQAGLFYYFIHTENSHTMVVTDQNQGFPAGAKPVLAVITEGGNLDTLTRWEPRPGTEAAAASFSDYDPTNPDTLVTGSAKTTNPFGGGSARDVTQWPALSFDSAVVTARATLLMQAAEAATSLVDAVGSNHLLSAGASFTLMRDPYTGAENVDYVVQSIRHSGHDAAAMAGADAGAYQNSLTVFPVTTGYKQKPVRARPVMAGVFAAVVLGDPNEEIHADNLGRIKVRMMWDHRKETTADLGVWARVIQPWAGNSWGWQHLPRVGTEVAVAFMDGDADRPVVLGGMYNANMQPPFAVPAEQTKSGFRSRSTANGGAGNFSEFSIDDKKGSELVFLHAEKDLSTEVENDQTLAVTGNRKVTVQKDETVTITGNRTETVNKQESITVAQGRSVTIQQGGDSLTVQAGDLTIAVSSGAISMQAMTKISLTVGSNSVTIDQSGITLNGVMIKAQGQAMVQVQGPMVQVSADAMLMLKGGITMVN